MKVKKYTYKKAGVDTYKEEVSLECLLKWVKKSLKFRKGVGSAELPIGYFANVVNIGQDFGIAISTDGVGSKLLVAQMMHKYDTVGIDCVAMNVNDIISVGAEPISMVDYLAVQRLSEGLLEEIGKGLYEGAKLSRISICGGEISQIKEMLKGIREDYSFDLVGTAIGIVPLEKIVVGQDIKENDVIVGLRSNGVHSNGLTLARKVFFEEMNFTVDKYITELQTTLGEELLKPTHIYIPEVLEMLNSDLKLKALIHITSGGFLNLTRVKSETGYIIENLPEPHPIFSLIQRYGNVDDGEMFKVFNMGIGFCIISDPGSVDNVIRIAEKHDVEAYKLGYAVEDIERKVIIEPYRLIGEKGSFHKLP